MSDQTQPAGAAAAECTRCGALLVPGTTATGTEQCAGCLWGPDPDWRAEDDAVPPQCRGCGAAIVGGYNDVPGEVYQRELCAECAPDAILEGDVLVLIDTDGPDAYNSQDTII